MGVEKVNRTVKFDIKETLKDIFPEVFEDNKINFQKLKALLNGEIIEKEDDRFYFNWAGKRNIYKLIQSPAYGTLKPDREKSVDFDNTKNIVIVGENLEALKLLLKPYFSKVKMIYIDPPYNTGGDFIYRDNFKEPLKDYLEKTGQIDSEGQKLTTNTEASGRFHSDWLNFIYPRLFLAKNLLREDGVIFISIDDNEVYHLRMIMDEIFGEENFISNFIWKKKSTSTNVKGVQVSALTDYVLAYGKTFNSKIKTRVRSKKTRHYPYEDEEGRYRLSIIEKKHAGSYKRESMRFPIIGVYPREGKRWQIGEETARNLEEKKRFILEKGIVKLKIYEFEDKDTFSAQPNLLDKHGSTDAAQKMLSDILGRQEIFDNPKPVELIKHLISITCNQDDYILDFFAGSGTTGHSVWNLNKEDEGNRKFILVQLDEEIQDEKTKKEFPTVADICIERLKRVSERYKKEKEKQLIKENKDFGFKVFKLDKSNFNLKDEFEIQQGQDIEDLKKKYIEWLGIFVDQPLVDDWQKIDVIYEVILKEGLNLNSKVEESKIKENNFYYVKDSEQNLEFYICLEDKIKNETIEEIRTSRYKGKLFVFMDKALTDNDKINLSTFVRLKVI